ncbi:hypothetical protein PSDVSF_09590 [Pseudodesulfovibrio sediminis]|uniref:Cobalt transport protein n=2 Tax=Pseudodesulfovibrio sediminis TaxID=2810563 RepID=A0ABN6ENE4_9BACT|nr:hypothetical protein PSDVSF_09590 [Pseudodesulfovibrio sediminis]
MFSLAAYARSLDPRLKMVTALVLGPCLWKIHVLGVLVCCLLLLALAWRLSLARPLGLKMLNSLTLFVMFWVLMKIVLDGLTGVPVEFVVRDALELGARLVALLALGLSLSLSTSPRALGLAVAWAIRPLVGKERAWRLALALALMIHFLPTCLATMAEVREVAKRRCPDLGFMGRFRTVPQAVIRNLGQKTWNQTLAVAGRRLDEPSAWESDFVWTVQDTISSLVFLTVIILLFIL